ncbi:MAG TPA: BamA/TamA family outer membrane protein, partial [Acidobacteriota bacterium]|nr:BamA/TamA family outer membrane protein [Acidobacteriota bacterium]
SSTKLYEQFEAMAEFFPAPASDSPFRAYVKAGYLDYRSHNFFGIGNFTRDEDETTFRLEQRHASAGASFQPHRAFTLSGEVGFVNSGIRSGEDGDSLEQLFDPLQVPGFLEQPEYLTYGGQVEVSFFDRWEEPPVGAAVRSSLHRFDGRGNTGPQVGTGSFLRAVAEVELRIPLGYRSRRIVYHLRTSHSMADGDADVPFFMQETIGGARSLRGYEEFRFRDTRNLTMNLEYRWEIWTFADMALFADAGKVFRRAGDLDFSDLHASYGAGLVFRTPGGFRLRFDVARSQEGIRVHIGSGPDF